jgi:branched-chain amino acid transport system permease protein
MDAVAQIFISGITAGAIYAAVAVGFNVIYRSGRVFNIAQGEMLMLSTFISMTLFGLGINPWLALFMSTLGLLLVFNGVGLIAFGTEPRLFPDVLGTERWEIGNISIKESAVTGTVLIGLVVAGLAWFFRSTRAGLLMTSVAEDHQVARSLGVDVHRSIGLSWAGRSVSPDVAAIAFVALPVVLLAGLETIGGVLVGGLIVGIGQSAAATWLDPLFEGGASLIFPFALMMVVLMVRPQGLFGWRRVERI